MVKLEFIIIVYIEKEKERDSYRYDYSYIGSNRIILLKVKRD